MTASTTNYLWTLHDLLGQGATACVYKARNKVGLCSQQAHEQFTSTCSSHRFQRHLKKKEEALNRL